MKLKERLRRLHARLKPRYAWVLENLIIYLLVGSAAFYMGYKFGQGSWRFW